MKTHEPDPTGTLYTQSSSVECLLKCIKVVEDIVDSLLEGIIFGQLAADATLLGRLCQVLPEQGVVDVTWSAMTIRGSARHN